MAALLCPNCRHSLGVDRPRPGVSLSVTCEACGLRVALEAARLPAGEALALGVPMSDVLVGGE